jgi:CheY-like chemotaxis protein
MLKSWGFTNLDSSNSSTSNLKKLLSGRVDLWVYDNLGMPCLAKKVGIDTSELEFVFSINEVSLYIAFSKGTSEKIVKKWQETLDSIKQDGTFEKISRKWLTEDSIPKLEPKTSSVNLSEIKLKIYTEDSPPGNYLNEGKIEGLAVDIVREILVRLKLPDNIEVVPWARGYTLALNQPNVALFDLVITDMSMPQMTGDRLVKEILKTRPDMPVILCTGFSEKIDEDKAKVIGVRQYIEKPINRRDLAFMVRKVLDEK